MAEQTQLSDNKISDALGLKMGLDPTGAMAVPKAPAAPKVSDESKNIIPQIDYTGLIKDVKTPSQALEMKAGLLGKEQQIDRNVLALEQQRTEKEAQLKLQNIEKSNEAIREEYEKMDKFYKDFPRPEFHPTKENMRDIATMFSLIGVVGTLLGGSGKASAMQSLSSMTGMMKGWREGRSDLWKKELQEFEKSTNAWKLKLEEARDGLKRALELQATNRQEADALAAVTVAKMGSPIVAEKVKKQGIQAGYTLLNEVQTALDKEIKQKFEEKKFNAEQAHRRSTEQHQRNMEIIAREKQSYKVDDVAKELDSMGVHIADKKDRAQVQSTVNAMATLKELQKEVSENPSLVGRQGQIKKFTERYLDSFKSGGPEPTADQADQDALLFSKKYASMLTRYEQALAGSARAGSTVSFQKRYNDLLSQDQFNAPSMIKLFDDMQVEAARGAMEKSPNLSYDMMNNMANRFNTRISQEPAAPKGGWTDEKERRYQELLTKQKQGS